MKTRSRYLAVASLALALGVTELKARGDESVVNVTARINESIMPIARGEKYGAPLDEFLELNLLGEVVGAGTSIGPNGGPAWVEIEMEVIYSEADVARIAQRLRELGAPEGSYLYFRLNGKQKTVTVK